MKNQRQKGFTLMEMMVVIAFFFMITVFIGGAMTQATRIQNITSSQDDMQHQGRHQTDQLIDDIHDSQLVLSTYTYNSTAYTSSNQGTIILQAPSYDTSGNALGTSDIIIYHLVGTSAPYTLNRIVVPASGSARSAVNDKKVVSNVNSLGITYTCDEGITGDGTTKTFTLDGVPTTTPVVVDNAVTLALGTAYQFTAPQNVGFTAAPAAPDSIDIIYPVDPTASPSQVTSVALDLKLQVVSSAFQDAAKTQTVEINSNTSLRNH